MSNKTLSVGASPKVVVEEVSGDLSVVGWDAQDLLIKGNEDEFRVRQDGEVVFLSSSDDLVLRIPKGASLDVKNVGGDMSLRGILGQVELKEIHGDLSVRDVGPTFIETIYADFSLRGAKGNLLVKKIYADAAIRDVDGDVTLETVSDDLALRNVSGNVKATVGADVVAYINPKPNGEYSIAAGDDLMLVLPPNADATLNLNGDEIYVDWPGIENDDEETSRVLTLGKGSAKVSLNAGGDLRVSGEQKAGESADEFGNFAGAMFDWGNFGEDFGRALSDKISRRVDQATRRAEQKMARASQKIGRIPPIPPIPPLPPIPPIGRGASRRRVVNVDFSGASEAKQSVSDEERMAILKMLQDKKITSEQADQLLAALEGGS
jgi:hypothetical protein